MLPWESLSDAQKLERLQRNHTTISNRRAACETLHPEYYDRVLATIRWEMLQLESRLQRSSHQ